MNYEAIAEAIAAPTRKRMAVKLLLQAQETLLLNWPAAHEKRRVKLLTTLHQAADDVREVWGDELL